MIELMVASLIAVIFMLAAGTGYIVNQKAYKANVEKLDLQQTSSQALEVIERRIREAATAKIPPSEDRLELFGQDGNRITWFRKANFAGHTNLYEEDNIIARQDLIDINFAFQGGDTNVVEVRLTLKDKNMNNVGLRASAALRNSKQLRNWEPE